VTGAGSVGGKAADARPEDRVAFGAPGTVVCWHGSGDGPEIWEPLRRGLPEWDVLTPAAPNDLEFDHRPSIVAELLGDGFDGAAFLAGFSWGASLAARFATRHPERVRGLVLVEGGHLDFADVPDFDPPDDRDALVAEFGVDGARLWGLLAEPNKETWPALQAASYPLLLVASAMTESFAAAVPRAEIVPGHGHEIPYDVVAAWLDRSHRH
jgi:pimeloyl-ACP methyl ester carboxylesterase